MSGIVPQVIESLAHYPTGIEHPYASAASLGVAALATYIGIRGYENTDEKYAVAFPNEDLMKKSIVPEAESARRTRLGPMFGELVGGGFLAVQLLGGLTYSHDVPNSSAAVAAVVDVSRSMEFTADLGAPKLTREQAAIHALAAANYSGNLTVVPAGESPARAAFPLTHDWRSNVAKLNTSGVDDGGTQLVSAIETASSLLPLKNNRHEGTIVVMTDGTVDDSASAIGDEAAALAKKGISLKVVVPGNNSSTYALPGFNQKYGSGIDRQSFDKLPAGSVSYATTDSQLVSTVDKVVHSAGTSREKRNWYWPGAIGAVLFATGFIADKWQRSTRKV